MSATFHDSDETLMLRYRDGDYCAFRELYHRHHRGLYRFIAWQSPRIDWAEEVAQDTWMRLHHARPDYQVKARFKTLLYQIARNRLIDLLRQHQAILASDMSSSRDDDDSPFDYLVDQAQEENPQEADLMRRQQQQRLHHAIHTLPHEQKEALIMQQFSGLSLDEIASLTGVTMETVRSRLRYAMKKLKQRLN